MNIFRQISAKGITLSDYPFLRELNMESYLVENEDILKLDDNAFSNVAVIDAEVVLPSGQRIDILAEYGNDWYGVIELKKGEINQSTLTQLQSYLAEVVKCEIDFRNGVPKNNTNEAIYEIIEKIISEQEQIPKEQEQNLGNNLRIKNRLNWVGVLVGTSIDATLSQKLLNGIAFEVTITNNPPNTTVTLNEVDSKTMKTNALNIPIGGIVLKRFKDEERDVFVVSDTYFEYLPTAGKNYTKYSLQGSNFIYNKSQLVIAIIKLYIHLNPHATLADIQREFPKSLNGNYEVVVDLDTAIKINQNRGKRYYEKAPQIITLNNGMQIVTTTQWGVGNINNIINKANKILNAQIVS